MSKTNVKLGPRRYSTAENLASPKNLETNYPKTFSSRRDVGRELRERLEGREKCCRWKVSRHNEKYVEILLKSVQRERMKGVNGMKTPKKALFMNRENERKIGAEKVFPGKNFGQDQDLG
jgi:hypothetical protein